MTYALETYDSQGFLVFSTAELTSNLVGIFIVTIPANGITASIDIPGGITTDDVILQADRFSSLLSPVVKSAIPGGIRITLNLYHFGSGVYDRRNFPVNYYITLLRLLI